MVNNEHSSSLALDSRRHFKRIADSLFYNVHPLQANDPQLKASITQIVLFTFVFGNKLNVLERKIYHMERSIQQDMHLLREYVDTNTDGVNKLAALVNNSLDEYALRMKDQECSALHNTTHTLNDAYTNTMDGSTHASHVITTAFQDQKLEFRKLKTSTTSSLAKFEESLSNITFHNMKGIDEHILAIMQDNVEGIKTNIVVNVSRIISEVERDVLEQMAVKENELTNKFESSINLLREEVESKVSQHGFALKAELFEYVKVVESRVLATFKNSIKSKFDETLNSVDTILNNSLTSVKNEIENKIERQKDIDRKTQVAERELSMNKIDQINAMTNVINNKHTSLSSEVTHMQGDLRSLKLEIESLKRRSVQTSTQRSPNIRLINGGLKSGRLEVFYNGQWGTVCDDGFGTTDALVVCRSLGYSGGIARNRAFYGEGSRTVWFTDVQCKGHESSIFECKSHRGSRVSCRHAEDVGIECA